MKKKPSKMDYLKEDEFFQKISERCNYIGTDLIRDVYYSTVKVIVQELRHKGVARLPDFGDMVVTMHKERNSHDANTGSTYVVPKRRIIKFRTDYKLKKYLNYL